MQVRQTFLLRAFSMRVFMRLLGVAVGLCLSGLALSSRAMPQNNVTYTPATAAFDNSPVCDATDLSNDSDEARGRPEWKPIIIDPNLPFPNNFLHPVTILEGTVPTPGEEYPSGELESNQAPSEVSEEEITWNHYTHDFTANVVPDQAYQYLLSSYANPPDPTKVTADDPTGREKCPDGTYSDPCHHVHMEVEWDNASLMDEGEGFQRIWGAVPEFVWPAVNDRVWVAGRWIFDCGHPGGGERALVKYSTEIHPPRALVTFRLNHPALDSFPVPRTSAPNFPGPQSFLPITGAPVAVPAGHANSGPTNVPVTEADIFVSGNGGGANDACQLTHNPGDDCGTPHTSPVIPLNGPNDPNYVFDVYPPGTNYHSLLNGGTFRVTPPVGDASLQWRIVDHSSELPAHTCGGTNTNGCVTAVPVFCLLDATTPPPNQTETGCPSVPAAHPTRLRVILPFAGTSANFFAQSILLGWDDVPGGQILLASANMKPNVFAKGALPMQIGIPGPVSTPIMRTFKVTLHALTVVANGEGSPLLGAPDGDWRVFVNVGGQYRYMDPFFDRNPDGSNKCNGDALTENGDGDCFLFDNTPWIVSVQDGTPIHVGVGGWESDRVDSHFCRNYNDPDPSPAGCAPDSFGDLLALATANNDRIGTYEFDLKAPDYKWSDAPSFTTENTGDNCTASFPLTCDELQYKVEFAVEEIPAAAAPTGAPLHLGDPHYINYVTSAAPLVLSTTSTDAQYFQYRFHHQGAPLTAYAATGAMKNGYSVPAPPTLPFLVYWTSAPIDAGSHSVSLHLSGADGPYDLQYSAQSFGQLLEPRHTETVILDNTPPVIGIVQPQPTTYPHSAVLTLNYSLSDAGSGVNQFTSSMDGMTTVFGHGLASGQTINLLTELSLGPHTFSIMGLDNVGNAGSRAVTFTIIVTPESIKGDVTQFLGAGKIKNQGEAQSLLDKLNAAANARAGGNCATANNIYQAFINELNAQSGNGVDATAAHIMIADAQYLMAHCP
ncbi:MAG: hypothetical protein LAO08_04935 [Acidobacteriia bacterium]|nr:hypothetical protein [Terriglobia bacterium]